MSFNIFPNNGLCQPKLRLSQAPGWQVSGTTPYYVNGPTLMELYTTYDYSEFVPTVTIRWGELVIL